MNLIAWLTGAWRAGTWSNGAWEEAIAQRRQVLRLSSPIVTTLLLASPIDE